MPDLFDIPKVATLNRILEEMTETLLLTEESEIPQTALNFLYSKHSKLNRYSRLQSTLKKINFLQEEKRKLDSEIETQLKQNKEKFKI